MRNNGKGLGFGIFLLTVGAIWLLGIAHIVTWSTVSALITLWPLILVAIGVGFIFRSNRLIRTLTWLILLTIVIGYGYFAPAKEPWVKYDLHFGGKSDYSNYSSYSKVSLEKQPKMEKADLTLNYGAMQINVDSATTALLDADINDALVKHSENLDGQTAAIKFEMKDENFINIGAVNKLYNNFHLSKDIVWNLILNTGAIDSKLDLKDLKVEKLDIRTGLSTINLDMGSYNTAMKIKSGASTVHITLPSDTGLKVKVDGGLNNTNLGKDGWEKDGDWYYSPDYDAKKFKIDAEIDSGLGNLTVENR